MKKNYALMILLALFMGMNVSAVDLVGVYKLGGLTDETTAALGRISPDAMFRIMPGDEAADYYMTGVAGYGCKWAVAYDESAGTLTVTDPSEYGQTGQFGMLLYFTFISSFSADATSLTFTVADGVLTIKDDIVITDVNAEEVVGTYTQGLTLTKQNITAPAAADLAGDYTFTGTQLDMMGSPSPVEYSMSVSQTEGNTLSINGFMGVDRISATYLPEVAMITITMQERDGATVLQMLGDIYFILSDDGAWTLTTPAMAELSGGDAVSLMDGTAVKGGSSAVRELPTGEEAVSVYGSNGFVYVVSDAPVAVQIYNAAGVQVYGSAAVSAPISLNKGYYLVRVAGNRKAVPVIL